MSQLTLDERFTNEHEISLVGDLGLSNEDKNEFGVLTSGDLQSVHVGAEQVAAKTIDLANQIQYSDDGLHKVLMTSVQELCRAWLFLPRGTTPRPYVLWSRVCILPESAEATGLRSHCVLLKSPRQS